HQERQSLIPLAAFDPHDVHLPAPSWWPLVIALGLLISAFGAVSLLALVFLGGAIALAGAFSFALEHHDDPAYVRQDGVLGVDHRKLAMWVFLASECIFFGMLISSYLAYKGRSVVGPYPHQILNIPLTTLSTFDLLMSSLLM